VLTAEIFEVIANKHLELGEFTELFTRRSDVEHAYDKLQGIEGKPPFDDVYPYLKEFVIPFVQKDRTPRIWNTNNRDWDDTSRVPEKRPSVRDQLRAAAQEARERPTSPQKSKHKHDLER